MTVPEPFEAVLLALAAFRVWRLLAEDTVLDPVRDRLVREDSGFEAFVGCPWCLGFWVSLAFAGAWWAWPAGTLVAAVPFALSALVGAAALVVWRLED